VRGRLALLANSSVAESPGWPGLDQREAPARVSELASHSESPKTERKTTEPQQHEITLATPLYLIVQVGNPRVERDLVMDRGCEKIEPGGPGPYERQFSTVSPGTAWKSLSIETTTQFPSDLATAAIITSMLPIGRP